MWSTDLKSVSNFHSNHLVKLSPLNPYAVAIKYLDYGIGKVCGLIFWGEVRVTFMQRVVLITILQAVKVFGYKIVFFCIHTYLVGELNSKSLKCKLWPNFQGRSMHNFSDTGYVQIWSIMIQAFLPLTNWHQFVQMFTLDR